MLFLLRQAVTAWFLQMTSPTLCSLTSPDRGWRLDNVTDVRGCVYSMCKNYPCVHCLSLHVCMRRRVFFDRQFFTSFFFFSAWCLMDLWRLRCLHVIMPCGVCWTEGLRCGWVRRLKGSHSGGSFACLEMRKTSSAETWWNTPGTGQRLWIRLQGHMRLLYSIYFWVVD